MFISDFFSPIWFLPERSLKVWLGFYPERGIDPHDTRTGWVEKIE
jgi:hypothetical protein